MNKSATPSKKLKTWLCGILLAFGLFAAGVTIVFYVNRGPGNTSKYSGLRRVTVKEKNGRYNFYRDGKPILIQGAAGFTHIRELSECGGNTITCWDTANLDKTIKEAARNNLAVIVGLDIPSEDTFYNNKKNVAALYNAYIPLVKKYKGEPSLLAWCLGNELVFPLSLFPMPFYKAYNKILDSIHTIDPNHPVCTSILNVSRRSIIMMKWRIPALDFYCLNIYNSIKDLQHQLDRIKWVWGGPYLIGEWAPEGGWEAPLTAWKAVVENTSTKKSDLFYDFFTKYMPLNDSRFLGSVAFYWGSRQEYTKSWFSIFDENGNATEIKEALSDCWKHTITKHISPRIGYMLIDGMGAKDNIIITAGSTHQAVLGLERSTKPDTLRYSWQIFKDWYPSKFPPAANGLFTDSAKQNPGFTAPLKVGPYRIFVTIYNSTGYCATSNIPFYVVK